MLPAILEDNMGLTVTKVAGFNTDYSLKSMLARGAKIEIADITFDSSYPTGGEELTFSFIPDIVLFPNTSLYWFCYDATNKKVLAYTATNTEVGNGTNLSTVSTKVLAIKVAQ